MSNLMHSMSTVELRINIQAELDDLEKAIKGLQRAVKETPEDEERVEALYLAYIKRKNMRAALMKMGQFGR